MFIKVVSDTVFDMINPVYHDKPLIIIRATFQEKLVSHHWAENEAESCLLMRYAGSKVVARTNITYYRTNKEILVTNIYIYYSRQIDLLALKAN